MILVNLTNYFFLLSIKNYLHVASIDHQFPAKKRSYLLTSKTRTKKKKTKNYGGLGRSALPCKHEELSRDLPKLNSLASQAS